MLKYHKLNNTNSIDNITINILRNIQINDRNFFIID